MNRDFDENEFSFRVRQVLDDGISDLDADVTRRLHEARQKALARHGARSGVAVWLRRPVIAAAGAGPEDSGIVVWARRFGLAAPLFALIIGIVGIQQWHQDRVITELADLDFAVLLDDAPIDTLSHQGFEVYLHSGTEDL